ncbi:hypothetical protein ASZ90_010196 [hydrocarbon metagenome]|uniref:Uncharacterized protein n=1 Tax=hydrocarbon metagenome TaxID=938273 RepID=A0A0W8FIC3_9ZZZZ
MTIREAAYPHSGSRHGSMRVPPDAPRDKRISRRLKPARYP